jgi:16S rRNA (cytosine1402-N4)-methyltransferase
MKPSDAEIDANPRSRSAVMRVARRLPIPLEAA